MSEITPTPDPEFQEPSLTGPDHPASTRAKSPWLISTALVVVAMLTVSFWWFGRPESSMTGLPAPAATSPTRSATRPPRPSTVLTRAAADAVTQPTATPTAAAVSSLVALPTVTPSLAAVDVATRTIELRGQATLRLALGNDTFQSRGDPVGLAIDPRQLVLGGNTLTRGDSFCVQTGPSAVVFDLSFTLLPVSEDLRVAGTLNLHDGFCSSLGSLGDVRATAPLEVTIPADAAAQLVQNLQAKSNLLGVNDVLNTSTGVYIELTIRNPSP
jgi:hypothetical protein